MDQSKKLKLLAKNLKYKKKQGVTNKIEES